MNINDLTIGKILTAGNYQTEYARSGMHAYNNQARRDAARASQE